VTRHPERSEGDMTKIMSPSLHSYPATFFPSL
jgi:hypothetical protein